MLRNVQNFAEIAQMLSKKHVQRFWNILPAYSRVWRSDFDAPRDHERQGQGLELTSTFYYLVNGAFFTI